MNLAPVMNHATGTECGLALELKRGFTGAPFRSIMTGHINTKFRWILQTAMISPEKKIHQNHPSPQQHTTTTSLDDAVQTVGLAPYL